MQPATEPGHVAETQRVTETRVIPRLIKAQGLTRCFVYSGPSMAPTLRPGHLLYVRPTAQDVGVGDISKGDVVVFEDPIKGCVVHRVVAVTGAGLITRGDNNAHNDALPVPPRRLVGRVELVEQRGQVRPLPGGRRGLWATRARRWLRRAERWLRRIVGAPYRALYNLPAVRPWLVRLLLRGWQVGRFQTPAGPACKFVRPRPRRRGRVVARWLPGQARPQIARPHDLFIHPDDLARRVIPPSPLRRGSVQAQSSPPGREGA